MQPPCSHTHSEGPASTAGGPSNSLSQGHARVKEVPTPPPDPSSFVGKHWDQPRTLTPAAITKAAPPVTFTKTSLESTFGWQHGASKHLRPTVVFRYASSMDGKQHEEVAQLLAPSRDDHDAEQAKRDGRPRVKVDGYPLPTDTLRKLYQQLGVTEGSRLRFESQGWQGTRIVMNVSVLAPAGQAVAAAVVPAAAASAATCRQQHSADPEVVDMVDDNESQETAMDEPCPDLQQGPPPIAAGGNTPLQSLATVCTEAEATAAPLPANEDSSFELGRQIVSKSRTEWLASKEVQQVLTRYGALGIKITEQPVVAKPGDLFLCKAVPIVDIQDGHSWEKRRNSDLKVHRHPVARVVYNTSKDKRLLRRVYELLLKTEPRLQLLHYHSSDGDEGTLPTKPDPSRKRSPRGGAAHRQQAEEEAAPAAAAQRRQAEEEAAMVAAAEAAAQRRQTDEEAVMAATAEAAAQRRQTEAEAVMAAAAEAASQRRQADEVAAMAATAKAAASHRHQAEQHYNGQPSAAPLDAGFDPQQAQQGQAEEQPHGQKRQQELPVQDAPGAKRQAVEPHAAGPDASEVVEVDDRSRKEVYKALVPVLLRAGISNSDRQRFLRRCIKDNTDDDDVAIHWTELSTCHKTGDTAAVREWVAVHLESSIGS